MFLNLRIMTIMENLISKISELDPTLENEKVKAMAERILEDKDIRTNRDIAEVAKKIQSSTNSSIHTSYETAKDILGVTDLKKVYIV